MQRKSIHVAHRRDFWTREKIMRQHPNATSTEKDRSHIIDMITSETHLPPDEVKRVFEAEIARLESGARVLDFLEVLAIKRTREALTMAH